MRVYIIANDGNTLSREAPAAMTEGEIAVTSKEELQPPRSMAKGFWHCGMLSLGSRSGEKSVIARR
jgi:hypothetical protein